MTFRPDGITAPDGTSVSWRNLRRVLLALPEVAHKHLGVVRGMSPPSKCAEAADELEEILNELFPDSSSIRR